jgi:hypothetical protein
MGSLLEPADEAHATDAPTDLRPALDDIRDLRDSLESYQGLEHSLVELAQATEFNHNQLSERVTDLRDAILELTEITTNASTGQAPRGHTARGRAGHLPRTHGETSSGWPSHSKTMAAIVFAGVLLTAWSIRAYSKTGNPYIAMLGLLVVNSAGCIAILIRRRSIGGTAR